MKRAALILAASFLATACITPCIAQVNTGLQPPTQETIVNGVDVTSGSLVIQQADLDLGQADSPNYMQLQRTYRSSANLGAGWGSFDQWEHNYKVYAISPLEYGAGLSDFDIVIGQEVHKFSSGYTNVPGGTGTPTPGVYVNLSGDGSTLTMSGSGSNAVLTFTSKNGDVTTFLASLPCSYVSYCWYGSQTQRADGVKTYFTYGPAGSVYANNQLPVSRLRWVTNSFGYGFKFSYLDEGTTSVTSKSRLMVNGVSGVKTDCPASPSSCQETVVSAATYQYQIWNYQYQFQPSNLVLSGVNAAGVSRTYTYDPKFGTLRSSFQAASPSTPEFVVEWADPPWGYGQGPFGGCCVAKKTDAAGFATTYSWISWPEPNGSSLAYKVTNALGGVANYLITVPGAQTGDRSPPWLLGQVWDESGGNTSLTYDEYYRVTKVQYPEGNSIAVNYDARGNVIKRTVSSKPSNPASDIVELASFASTCVPETAKVCNKPSYVIDGRGFRTSYSWSPLHGGMELKAEGLDSGGSCLIPGGVCPQINQAFGSFSAQDGSTVYLLASRTKRIDASSTTTEAFGYSASRQMSLNKSVNDANGVNLITCHLHDAVGNEISRTLPRAGLTTCQ